MSDITLSDVLSGQLEGNGHFDKIMESYRKLLKEEFENERITGGEYSQVFLGLVTHAMDKAMEFALTEERAGYEGDLAGERVTTEQKQQAKLDAEIDVLERQEEKVQNETQLVYYKRLSEQAQTSDTAGNSAVAGVIGRQYDLLDAQEQGYRRDAEQKAAKVFADVFAVMYRSGNISQSLADDYGFSDTRINATMQKLYNNISVS